MTNKEVKARASSCAAQGREGGAHEALAHDLPASWRWARLGDVCQINPRRGNLNRSLDAPTTFIPMNAVDETIGAISGAILKRFGELANGYTFFEEGDVLFAKITPCMQNGKHAIARGLIDGVGFGTTEFHVLRPGPNVLSEWIWNFVRQPSFLRQAEDHFRGAVGQQRVPKQFLEAFMIPIPPLPVQAHISAFLCEQLETARRAREAALARLEAARALPAAFLRSIFESEEAEQWPRRTLGEVADIAYGVTKDPTRTYGSNQIPYLRVANVQAGWFDLSVVTTIHLNLSEYSGLLLQAGDLLFTEGNSRELVGRCAHWDAQIKPCTHQNHILRARVLDPAYVNPRFLYHYARSPQAQRYFFDIAKQTTGIATMNSNQLKALPVVLPDLHRQNDIAQDIEAKLKAVNIVVQAIESQLSLTDVLTRALLRKAFAGEL